MKRNFAVDLPKWMLDSDQDNEDDMFADMPCKLSKLAKTEEESVSEVVMAKKEVTDPIHDTRHEKEWDDKDGYYIPFTQETIGKKYAYMNELGRGVFASVVLACDISDDTNRVAIKIVRRNTAMRKTAQQEIEILQKVTGTQCFVKFIESFDYRSHLCLAFEAMRMNLRDMIKLRGNKRLDIHTVRLYAKQFIDALGLLKQARIVHADIKPDNILVSQDETVVKLADFGSAFEVGTGVPTNPYLVSRYYRAPEIILGVACDHSCDMWSIGCTLYEICSGSIIFPGRNNNHMLKLMMETKARFPLKMLRKANLGHHHFELSAGGDANVVFLDLSSGQLKRFTPPAQPQRTVKSMMLNEEDRIKFLQAGTKDLSPDSLLMFHLAELVDKMLVLNPEKRLKISDALLHPFLAETTSRKS
jgi:serine/threonine-protein kinase PRP4